jgi:hypothetical protein
VPAPHPPFASSSLSALRLLVGFALIADEASPGRDVLLGHAAATGARPCQALAAVLCALRRSPAAGGVLDGILAATLGREAARYVGAPASALARCWREHGDSLPGRTLTALLWQVARREGRAFRELEDEIARACSPFRLVPESQRAFDPVPRPDRAARRAAHHAGDPDAA